MKSKEIAKVAQIVRESFHRMDPYGLLADGGPADEFDSEINSVVSQLQRCNSARDVAHSIARTLNSSFSEKHSPEEFEKESELIFSKLQECGLK